MRLVGNPPLEPRARVTDFKIDFEISKRAVSGMVFAKIWSRSTKVKFRRVTKTRSGFLQLSTVVTGKSSRVFLYALRKIHAHCGDQRIFTPIENSVNYKKSVYRFGGKSVSSSSTEPL